MKLYLRHTPSAHLHTPILQAERLRLRSDLWLEKNILLHPEPGKLHQRWKLAGVEVGSSWDPSTATTHHHGPSSLRRGLSEAEECGPEGSKRYLPAETPGHILRATCERASTWGWGSRWVSPGLQNPAPLHQQASSAPGTHFPAMKPPN